MTLSEDLRNSALDTIAIFSVGSYTLKHANSKSYDAATGSNTITYTTTTADMAQDRITEFSTYDQSYSNGNMIFLVSGIALGDVVPEVGDVVVTPAGTEHEVVKVDSDQYGAVYILYAKV